MADEKNESFKNRTVVLSSDAVTSMLLHAAKHSTSVVHGVLLGTYDVESNVQITKAVPVCHEAPTKPLVETALALIASAADSGDTTIVGWYSAPERLSDTKPSSSALRIVASLDSRSKHEEPVLLVLQNEALVKGLQGEISEPVVKAYGKDFGQQWLEPLANLELERGALEAAREAYPDSVVHDFVDHLEAESASTDWYPN